jgi:hypothetical protein
MSVRAVVKRTRTTPALPEILACGAYTIMSPPDNKLSHGDEVQQVRDMLVAFAKADSHVLKTPAPADRVMELGDSQVEYVLRAYANPADGWMENRKLNLPYPNFKCIEVQACKPVQFLAAPGRYKTNQVQAVF